MEQKQLKLPMFRIEKIESNEDRQFFNFGSEINKKLDNLIIELKNHKDFKDLIEKRVKIVHQKLIDQNNETKIIKDFKLFETFIFSGYSIILGSGDHHSRSSSDSNQGKIPFWYARIILCGLRSPP